MQFTVDKSTCTLGNAWLQVCYGKADIQGDPGWLTRLTKYWKNIKEYRWWHSAPYNLGNSKNESGCTKKIGKQEPGHTAICAKSESGFTKNSNKNKIVKQKQNNSKIKTK